MVSRLSDKLSLNPNASRVLAQHQQHQQHQHQQQQQQLPSPSLSSSPASFVSSTPHSSTTRSSLGSSLPSSVPSHHHSNSWHGSAHRQKPPGGNQHIANIIKPLPHPNDILDPMSHNQLHQNLQYQSLQSLQQQHSSPQPSANPISFKPTQPLVQVQQPQRTAGRYSLSDFIIHRTLGTGSFGRVHLGTYAIRATPSQPVHAITADTISSKHQCDRNITCGTTPSKSLQRKRSTG
jgi:hypothetical protein